MCPCLQPQHSSGCGKASLGKLSRCALTLCLQMCTNGNHLALQMCRSIPVPSAVCSAVTSGTSPAVGLNAAASPRLPSPPRCEHPGDPWCPRCMRKSLPPHQLCPKSPPDVNTRGDPDVQTCGHISSAAVRADVRPLLPPNIPDVHTQMHPGPPPLPLLLRISSFSLSPLQVPHTPDFPFFPTFTLFQVPR